jgi:hypothetical protein
MSDYKPKKSIDDYIENNELNSRIYEVLLCLNDRKTCEKNRLKKEPLKIFNQAYIICWELQKEKHPEQIALEIWERVRSKNLLCETNIIFSCVYVILFFSVEKNPNMKFFFSRIRQRIDRCYFQDFEPLIREELTNITAQTTDFEQLKKQADQITDLDERELFLANYSTHFKQDHCKGNIIQQIDDEINLIRTTKELSDSEVENPNKLSIKTRAVALMLMLNKMGLGTAFNDKSDIAQLISDLTGISYTSVYKNIRGQITFTSYHSTEIEQLNSNFVKLNSDIRIEKIEKY